MKLAKPTTNNYVWALTSVKFAGSEHIPENILTFGKQGLKVLSSIEKAREYFKQLHNHDVAFSNNRGRLLATISYVEDRMKKVYELKQINKRGLALRVKRDLKLLTDTDRYVSAVEFTK